MVVPVAIFGSEALDVSSIDQSSLKFGKTGGEDTLKFCLNYMLDINRDGFPDLTCFFGQRHMGFLSGDLLGILKGKTTSNLQFIAEDAVKVIH